MKQVQKLTVYTNKLVSLGNTCVGRIDKDSYATSTKPTTFYTGKIGNYNVPHIITAPLYIGGPADWDINPNFTAEIAAIVSLCDQAGQPVKDEVEA